MIDQVALVSLYGLATWRLASLIIAENGPFSIFQRWRSMIGVYDVGEVSGLATLFSCIWCLSVWFGIVLTLAHGVIVGWDWWLLLLPFAISALTLIINRLILSGTESRSFSG